MAQDVLDPVAEVIAVAQQPFGARPLCEQEDQERLVSLGGVAALAGQHQVVAPVVRRLSLPRGYVIECERAWGGQDAAIRADGTVALQQPIARLAISDTAGGLRRVLGSLALGGASPLSAAASWGWGHVS